MFARIFMVLFRTTTAILLVAIFSFWSYSYARPGILSFPPHHRVGTEFDADGRRQGYILMTQWTPQWWHGRARVLQAFTINSEHIVYDPPPGFSYDQKIAEQLDEQWKQEELAKATANSPRIEREPLTEPFDDSGGNWLERRGFGWTWFKLRPTHGGAAFGFRGVAFPLWFPAMLCVAVTLLLFASPINRSIRRMRGCCVACGYDLRASRERCPECGKMAVK